MTLLAGHRGVYEVHSLLGAGGMGEVYRARDGRLHRDVAIKILPASFAADPERMARFEQEARAAAALNHPNIVAVHDLGERDGAPFLVTELLEGLSLRDTLRESALPPRKAIDYSVQIAQGLAAAHEKGIVHRDLKPDNLWIRPLDSLESRPLIGTEGATYPFWSPDGSYIAFFAQGKLKKIAVAGGPPIAVCDSPSGRGASWAPDGTIIFSSGPTSPIFKVPAAGGTPVAVTKLQPEDPNSGARYPSFLPDGRHFFYLAASSRGNGGVFIGSVDGGDPVPLMTDVTNVMFVRPTERDTSCFAAERH